MGLNSHTILVARSKRQGLAESNVNSTSSSSSSSSVTITPSFISVIIIIQYKSIRNPGLL